MLIDMHAHTSGISRCCRIPYDKVIDIALERGIDGIVLTNHYQRAYVTDGDADAFARRYIEEYHRTREYGERVGAVVFFGVEVTMEKHGGAHLLVYGTGERFVTDNPEMYEYTQRELYEKVKAAGGVCIQAHPYRKSPNLLDTAYLDGVEINCHPLYGKSDAADMIAIARESNITLTCGGDYHADTYRPRCGTYLPESVRDSIAVARYLADAEEVSLLIHEPNTPEPYSFEYNRRTGEGK